MKYNFKSSRHLVAILAAMAAVGVAQSPEVSATEASPVNLVDSKIGTFQDNATPAYISAADVETNKQNENIITITHTNDIHGRLQQESKTDKKTNETSVKTTGVAQAAEFHKAMDSDIVVDAGDTYQGLPLSNSDDGKAMNEAIVKSGYQAIAVGNHEFDFGLEPLSKYGSKSVQGYTENDTPLLSTNTFYTDPVTGEKKQMFQGSKVIDVKGYKIALIGTTTPETYTKTHPKNLKDKKTGKQIVDFLDPLVYLTKEMDKLIEGSNGVVQKGDDHIDAFVILAHLGIDPATKQRWNGGWVAEQLSKNDKYKNYQIIFIDGHSHTKAPAQSFGKNVIYQQTGTALETIGLIQFNPEEVGAAKGRLYDANEVSKYVKDAKDANIQAIVDTAQKAYDAVNSEVLVDKNPVYLDGVRASVRTKETNLGNYITDAMMTYARTGGFNNPSDFAMINGGGIREDIKKDAPITKGDVIAVLPFGNIISQIKVTGKDVYDMFEHAYRGPVAVDDQSKQPIINEKTGLPELSAVGGFLHVSDDIKIYYDPTLPGKEEEGYNPSNPRVQAIYLKNQKTGKYELMPNTTDSVYYMATNDFLAQGGDGFDMLSGDREEGPSLDQVVIDVMKQGTLDLAKDYADPTPFSRIIPIKKADFQAQKQKSASSGSKASQETKESTASQATQKATDRVITLTQQTQDAKAGTVTFHNGEVSVTLSQEDAKNVKEVRVQPANHKFANLATRYENGQVDLYNITALDAQGNEVAITSPAQVRLPIQAGQTVQDVVHYGNNFEIADSLAFTVRDGYVEFTAPNFSYFGVIYQSGQAGAAVGQHAASSSTTSTSAKKDKASEKELPKTGSSSVLVLAASTILSGLGMAVGSRRKK